MGMFTDINGTQHANDQYEHIPAPTYMYINDNEYGQITTAVWHAIQAVQPDADYNCGSVKDNADINSIFITLLRSLEEPHVIYGTTDDDHQMFKIWYPLTELRKTANFTTDLYYAINEKKEPLVIRWS